MKKLLLFLVMITVISSCSKDDNTNTPQVTNNDLIGTWKVTAVTSENGKIKGDYTTPAGDISINSDLIVTGKDYNMTITFADNPKKISNTGSFVAIVKVSIPLLGERSFEQTISEIPATAGEWNVQNNILTASNNGKSTSINIVSYNQSEIVFSYPLNSSLTKEELAVLSIKNATIEGSLVIKAIKQ